MNPADPIPAVPESAASGELAALYADIRQTLNVPFVNLVWRHLATIPGALPWVWSAVRPLYALSAFDLAADALARVPTLDTAIEPCLPEALQLIGIGQKEGNAINAMLADYGHANARALLALLAAGEYLTNPEAWLATAGPGDANKFDPGVSPGKDRTSGDVLPLPGLDVLSPATLRVIGALNSYGQIADTVIIGSLYRHLAHWPGFLALACTVLARPQRDGVLSAEVRRILDEARSAVRQLPWSVPDVPSLAPASRIASAASLTAFTDQAISRMVVMGAAMRRLLAY